MQLSLQAGISWAKNADAQVDPTLATAGLTPTLLWPRPRSDTHILQESPQSCSALLCIAFPHHSLYALLQQESCLGLLDRGTRC